MVARSPDAGRASRQTAAAAAAAAALNPALVRETLKKVDRCMARLQELQYTVAGGAKVVSGVSLSPRSTRGYLRTSLRCKQETARMRATPAHKRSPNGKFGGGECGAGAGQWRRMSLPAMLLGETVLEIVQASKFAGDIVTIVDGNKNREPPKTPKSVSRTRKVTIEATPLRARRAREKQSQRGTVRAEASTPPSRGRVRSRIQFKPISPSLGRPSVSANRVSPRNRPWAKKTVMFPNPTFLASAAYDSPSPSKKQKRFYKTRSPVIARQQQTPHKFLVKSPPSSLGSKLKSHGKLLPSRPVAVSPPRKSQAAGAAVASASKSRRCTFSPSRFASRLVSSPGKAQAAAAGSSNKGRRCSFSPSRLATRLVSPIKARLSLNRSRDGGVHGGGGGGAVVSGQKQRPGVSMTVRTVSRKIPS